jgi:hypothetical protein
MEFDEAKNALKTNYVDAGFELTDEHRTELFFRYPGMGEVPIRVSEDDIKEYAACEALRPALEPLPVECSICGPDYREHMLDFPDAGRRRHLAMARDGVFVFGEPAADALYAEVGQASALFVNHFRFDEAFRQASRDRIHRFYLPNASPEMRDMLFRPLTVRVYNLQAPNVETALKHSTPIVDACLFELSYLTGITLVLAEEWPRRHPRRAPFQFGELVRGHELPLPRVNFNPDIVRFYQQGMSTDDPVNQFLSFYRVLEYYFVEVSDEQLYEKLSRRINDPRFTTAPTHLDRIIQDTLTHRRETDEIEMLKLVLSKFVEEADLIEFIKAYEEYLNDHLYTRKRSIFGESIEVKAESGHVIGNLAKRVKVIRNALVHSSDRYERNQRYVPTASAESMISREIPIMKYLAEKVIIGTASH